MVEGTSSLLIFLTTASITVLSWFFLLPHIPTLNINIPFFPSLKSKSRSHSKSILRTVTSNLLLLHTLLILHKLVLLSPPNLFTRLHLSLSTPTDAIRSLLLVASADGSLPPRIDRLLKRLGSAEMRILYVKFGHETITNCDFCSTFFDYALYTATGVGLEYLREAAIIGLVTIKSTSLERYRSLAIGILVAAAAGEAYWLSSVVIPIPRDGRDVNPIMWYDTLTLLRNILFLLLPLIIHFALPPSPPRVTQEALNSYNPNTNPDVEVEVPTAVKVMHELLNRLQLIRMTRGAFARIEGHSALWAKEKAEGAWVREDEEVKKVAKGLGLDYSGASERTEGGEGVGELREKARRAVGMLFRGFVPSGFWKPQPPQPQPQTS
ncbi:hypothetical protein V5O48_008664 [Marasmius crinis-equi]|uniref:Uncharacterized protein n=1 Tax=Marasmius crinis-equi TaxID=585013 RepID=A0ABR3FDG1_9AGAR